ncbi:DNA-formamidopyrimidine glycosylase family protein [Streptomyces sp. DSM 44915]|uniref:DNA-formamidopyrimidine glycosylase family protein n=1 Tax=Streptomyces chisholmiae TaxID=3075540 RepID=A0ABU2JV89_9ACTN|nr:DNA-formamidopyrimidine glycosylase family protein [Streptomyces sp. DSM 44915]MDT0268459.1 DNA-formamidopyrimidine glycosylase family protein [Streptomyces sp. DSM 44915]
MPELADVEEYRRVLDRCGRGHRVTRVEVTDAGVLRGGLRARRLRDALTGARIGRPERHGKWLVLHTGGPAVLLHFGMTGQLVSAPADERPAAHDRVLFTLDDGRQLRFRDQRKLKGLWLAPTPGEVDRLLADQGPDALSLTREQLDAALGGRPRQLKAALLDQSRIAGLGNLLTDEVLWHARLHPAHRTDRLDRAATGRISRSLKQVLRISVRAGRVPPRGSWLTGHRDEPGGTCPRCGHALAHGRIAGRGTVWCPRDQPAPAG